MSFPRWSTPSSSLLGIPIFLCLAASGFDVGHYARAADGAIMTAGEAIYQQQCANCHGSRGEGTQKHYPEPLVGDNSIRELASLIAATMPEGAPDQCVAQDALAVATFVHESFYSHAAEVRNRPPRQRLQRLTADQLRQSLTDILAHFFAQPSTEWTRSRDEQGLQASYYSGNSWKPADRKIDRRDPTIHFDFGTEGPGKGIPGDHFHVQWNGSLRVPATGRYEIIVRSTTAFELRVGSERHRLIDNLVQSAGRTEFREWVTLTAGRLVPLRLELNQRKRKNGTPPSSISLSWIAPGGVEEIIPAEFFSPEFAPPVLMLSSQLPPDDSSYGFERGIAVDAAWDEAVTEAALEIAGVVHSEIWPRESNARKDDAETPAKKLRAFLQRFVAVAHRGTVEETAAAALVDRAIAQSNDEAEAITRVVLMTIKSPRFLYPNLDRDRSPSRRVANRLSLTLHDSLPSHPAILKTIERNQLVQEKQIQTLATRMADDARTRAKIRQMLLRWLDLRSDDDLLKSNETFPGFDDAVIGDLRKSLCRFLDDVFWAEASDYRQLVSANWTITTDRLHQYYGDAWQPADADAQSPLTRSIADPSTHVGVITHPLVLTKLSHFDESSPIHRGVFLIRQILGRTLRPPNIAFVPLSPDLHPELTTRERVELQTSPESCQICHSKINPLGFTLEQYDADGRFRTTERAVAIDSRGKYVTRDDRTIDIANARELGNHVAHSRDAHEAFVTEMFQYLTKQTVAAFGADRLESLTDGFVASGFNMRELMIEIAVVAARDAVDSQPET